MKMEDFKRIYKVRSTVLCVVSLSGHHVVVGRHFSAAEGALRQARIRHLAASSMLGAAAADGAGWTEVAEVTTVVAAGWTEVAAVGWIADEEAGSIAADEAAVLTEVAAGSIGQFSLIHALT